jgi:sulfite reductase (NADPH) flavoprotein alpha-component
VQEKQPDPLLEDLLAEGQRERLLHYLHSHELWDLLLSHPRAAFTPQELADLLPPLLPRFYSIASSKQVVGEEVHLTVALTHFETREIRRHGVGSYFLCHSAPLGTRCVPTYLHPSNGFTLPSEEHIPIIMVGPGTGVAPFRGFMQERLVSGSKAKSWLFFGDWHKDFDFLYDDFWNHLSAIGQLKLECAFSRDQAEKVYVQHKMLENAGEIWSWLSEGAYIYVCGDAERMAKEVDQVLHHIVKEEGGYSEEAAKAFLKKLRTEKRYLRDVY